MIRRRDQVMLAKAGLILLLLGASAPGQTYQEYDAAGNHIGNLIVEGNRIVQRGLAGDSHGYWTKQNGYIEHRDNGGDLLSKVKIN